MIQQGILVTLLLFAVPKCSAPDSGVSLEEEQAAIRMLHDLQRVYHFKKDSVAFASQLSDQFISVNRGVVSKPERQATISRYHNYFSSVEFVRWDDVAEPILRFSEDGSMAYTIVDKIVVVDYETTEGETIRDSTHFTWTAIYRKYPDGWKIDAVTSTER